MKIYKRAILPLGFEASGVWAGIKKSGKPDLGLVFSRKSCNAAAVFTKNNFAAAPVKFSKALLKRNKLFHGIVVNSGNANCFTSDAGLKKAKFMSEAAAKSLGSAKDSILVASTGIIGKQLDVKKVINAMPSLVKGLSNSGINKFSQSILTTDKFKKEITVKFTINNKTVTFCGVCKGAGMIAPNMATMLCFIFTDLEIGAECLKRSLKTVVADSFNSISVDGCQSTNDTVLILANGSAGNKPLNSNSRDYAKFLKALNFVCLELAKMIVIDGEGASKIIKIDVIKAKTQQEAKKVGMVVANSNLFKTAMYGADPNFGRIVQAIGVSGVGVKEKDLKLSFSPLKKKEIKIKISLGRGNKTATVYTSDLTPEYIRINSKYN